MGLAALRFVVTGAYHLTGGGVWKATAGWVGLLLGLVAFYTALAMELEGTTGRTVLPLGRRGPGLAAVQGGGAPDTDGLATEPGVRPQL
jgi:hypothetical protein